MPKQPRSTRKYVLVDCPCGSGKRPRDCHLDPIDGRLRKELRSLRPPGPATGFAHSRCYLRDTNDCSSKISREHYISDSLLTQLGNPVRVSGMPWQSAGQRSDVGVGSLTAKILCDRHNSALSPLDTEAALFLAHVRTAFADLSRRSLSRKPKYYLVSGEAIELWMLKVATGIYHSVGTQGGMRLSSTHAINLSKVRHAFFERVWQSRGGLYFKGSMGDSFSVDGGIGVSPLSLEPELRFVGATATFLGLSLDVLFDTTGCNPGVWAGLTHRPYELVFKRDERQHSIILTWPRLTPLKSVIMERRNQPA